MKTKLTGLLLVLPALALAQFINLPNNEFPIFTLNPLKLTDHTTDVSNIDGYVLQTGFFQGGTEFWGYDATGPTQTHQNTLADSDADQGYFATFHDNFGNMLWYLVSDQTGTSAVSYGTSKIGYDKNTGTYKVCVEYTAPTSTPLTIVSSSGSGLGIITTAQHGLLTFEVDMAGNILASSLAATNSSPILLGDIDVENASSTGEMYIHATRSGFINRAFVGQHTVGINGFSNQVNEMGMSGSTARGIDVEDGKVFIVGDFNTNCNWGGGFAFTGAPHDIYVAEFDLALTISDMTIANAAPFAESYDIEAFPTGGPSYVYVSGAVENGTAWFGSLGAAPPDARHGFIQSFFPDLSTPSNYAVVRAVLTEEFFKMTDLEEAGIGSGTSGVIDIGGNMNHIDPIYEVYSSSTTVFFPLSSPTPEVGFALRVDANPDPVWTDLSTLQVSTTNPAPTITCISGYEDDIFVGGYKNEEIALMPMGQPNVKVPNLGNTSMNAFITYIFNNSLFAQGDFYKTGTPATADAVEEGEAWSIYPNPTSGYIYFSTSDATPFNDIRLKDITGRTIKAWNGSEAVNGLSVAGLPAGLYLIEVEQNGAYETHRLVIE